MNQSSLFYGISTHFPKTTKNSARKLGPVNAKAKI